MQIFTCNVKIYIWIEYFFNMVSFYSPLSSPLSGSIAQWLNCSIVFLFCSACAQGMVIYDSWFSFASETVRNRLNVLCELWALGGDSVLLLVFAFFARIISWSRMRLREETSSWNLKLD